MSTVATITAVLAVAYRWISYLDEVADKRVSDWDHAVTCARCGATIVHVYTVSYADGKVEELGKECLGHALGYRAETARKAALAALANADYRVARENKRARMLRALGGKLKAEGPRGTSLGGGHLVLGGTPRAAICTVDPAADPATTRLVAFTHATLPGVILVDFLGSHSDYVERKAALLRAGWEVAQ